MKCLKKIWQKIWYEIRVVSGSVLVLILSLFSSGLALWYTIWFVLGGIYLCYNWTKAMTFVPFNGHALIFMVWLVMIFRPFIKDINFPWFKLSDVFKNQSGAKREFERELENAENQKQKEQKEG